MNNIKINEGALNVEIHLPNGGLPDPGKLVIRTKAFRRHIDSEY